MLVKTNEETNKQIKTKKKWRNGKWNEVNGEIIWK